MGVTGIFGGRFDPPHVGHLALARAAVEQLAIDRLHIAVVVEAAHKESFAPAADRYAMARLTFAQLDVIVDAVVELEEHRYTVDALEARDYGDAILLIGADELADFPTWKEHERVLELARLGVAARPGYPPATGSERIQIFELEPNGVSSSEIRSRVRHGEPIEGLVLPDVAGYIAQHGLYRDG
jgi:nicotinate-nucleotide adenylyltransferase